MIVLLDEHHYVVHSDGRTDGTFRKIYRIDQQDAIDEWSEVEQEYQPWYQQKPEIRARVIDSDGTVHALDPNTIADAPARQFESSIFSDARVLRAPLPSIALGSIIEYQIVVRDKVPLLDAGVTHRIVVNDTTPLERFHALIEAEPHSSLRIAKGLVPDAVIHDETSNKGTRVELELGPLDARKDFEFDLPPDEPTYPYLSFSTGMSWQAVAARYEGIVNDRLRSADLKSLFVGLDLKGAPQDIASKLAAALHRNIRYTGVEFGEAAIVPATPDEVLRRGYGDCKDKSALLVAMLRLAGLPADVALLSSGFGTDVDATCLA